MNIVYQNDLFYVVPAENRKGYEVINKETGVTEFEHGFQWLCKSQADHLQMSLTAWNQQRVTKEEPDVEGAEREASAFWKKIQDENP